MKQLLIAGLTVLWAAPSLAAPVLVRSGEHGSFTRIVVDTNPSNGWEMAQDGRTVTLDLARNPDGFQTSGVFRRITRDRLQDIGSDGRRLTLRLGCDCVVTATAMAPNYIILDIAPGEAGTAETVADQPVAPNWSDSIAATEDVFGLGAVKIGEGAETQTEIAAPAPAKAAEPAGPVVLPLVQDPAERRPFELGGMIAGGPLDEDESAADAKAIGHAAEEMNVLEDRLAQQIGLAATQGLLKPAPDHRRELARQVPQDATNSSTTAPAEASIDPLMNRGGLPGNLRISSSVEGGPQAADSVATTIDGLSCLDGDLFAVQDWGTEGQFGADIARHRNALYTEFDRLDRDTQIALARAYLYFGFGAEALQIASLDVRDEQVDSAIMILARLMEYGPGPKTEGFARFAECNSDVALWAVLADDGTGRHERINTDAALRALNKLPYHLRSFVAPELSKRLRAVGDANSAAHAMRSLSRTPHEPESPARLEQAEIDLAGGHRDAASKGFEKVIEGNSFEAPRALIRYIDLQVANGEAISKDTALLAEAYAAEHRDSDLAPEITRAHMMALAKSGQFDEAFVVLGRARKENMESGALLTGLYATLRSDADDVTFLKRTLALTETDLFAIDERTRLVLAERLLELGFSAQSERIIAEVDRSTAPREQQLLRGRIHLDMGHDRQALAAAAAFDGPDFDALRADALYASGRFAEAAEIYSALGQAERAASAAWKAPTGALPDASEDSSLLRTADLADRPAPAAEGGLLARAGALLSDSTVLSEEIEDLLANPELIIGSDG